MASGLASQKDLWASLLALRPSEDPGHDPRCAGIDEWLLRRDRQRTCKECWSFLLHVWTEDRAARRAAVELRPS